MRLASPQMQDKSPWSSLLALGFLSYCLYTDADSIAYGIGSGVTDPALFLPYDAFSLGMLLVLAAGTLIAPVRRLISDERALVAGTVLMAMGPLYAMLIGAGHAAYLLATLGGLGKAIVLLHLGKCLVLAGAFRAFWIATFMGAASLLAEPLLSVHPAVFSILSLVAAPTCGVSLGLYEASCLRTRPQKAAKGRGGEESGYPTIALKRLSLAIILFAAATVLCTAPIKTTFEVAGGQTGAAASVPMLLGVIVAVVLLLLPPSSLERRCWRALKTLVASLVVAIGGFLAFSGSPAALWMSVSSLGPYLFQLLFFALAPFARSKATSPASSATQDASDFGRGFAVAAFAYCASLSTAVFVVRHGSSWLAESQVLFCGLLLLVTGALVALPVPLRSDVTVSEDYDALWGKGVGAIAERYGLSARETEVFALASRGYDSRAIQEKLVISPSTVSTHLQSIYKKLDLHSRQELIKIVEDTLDKQSS